MRHRARALWAIAFVLAAGVIDAAAQGARSSRVIVELALPSGGAQPEGRLGTPAAVFAQRGAIASAADRVAARLPRGARGVLRRFTTVPYIVVEADAATRAALAASPDVVRVMDDKLNWASLAQSVPLIQGDQAWDAGYDGTGTAVAILDTGVDSNHPFLAGKVIDEACFSSNIPGTAQSTCPNGSSQQLGPGAAVPCSIEGCLHGTHVAGIATGNGATAGQTFSGVAKGASVIAVQVFSVVTDRTGCGGGPTPCAGAYDSDIIAGLEHVYAVAASLNVASVNMSLGGATFTTTCDGEPEKPSIDNLRAIGVATVIASGNGYSGNSISSPGCISSAVSVGATDKSNNVALFSNVAPFMSLFAPGDSINSSVPGGGYQSLSGTSMATPHVAGAWAIMRQAVPGASVSAILNAFRSTGMPITDDRIFFGFGTVVPRVSILQALATFVPITNPVPSLTSMTPTRVRAGMGDPTFTITGTGFNALSFATWNGTPVTTTYTNTTTLQATVPGALITGTSGQVAVTNPSPGGGTTGWVTVTIDPPAVVTVNATGVPPSSPVTMTLTGGFGGASDWLALAQADSPNTSYLAYTYVGMGVTTRTWTVTMPSTPGQYEFRYFPDNGFVRAGTSPTVTVDASLRPAPAITSVSPPSAQAGGAAFTLTVNGTGFVAASVVQWNGSPRPTTFISSTQLQAAIGAADIAAVGSASICVVTPPPGGGTSSTSSFTITPPPPVPVISSLSPAAAIAGGAGFTLTVNGSGFTNTSVVRWNGSNRTTTFSSSTQLQAAIGAADIAAIGTAQVSVFTPAPGGGTSGSLPFTIEAAPTLSVSATTASPGTNVTVTLTGGFGGAMDWLALAATSAPNTNYLAYTYVGYGVTTRTWTVAMPQTNGTYEFRLFLNNGYTRAATSPTVTVIFVPPPVPVVSSLAPASAFAASGDFTLTVNGSGFTSGSVVNWNGSPRTTTFVSSTQVRAAIANADIATPGTAQVTVFTPAPGGGTSAPAMFTIATAPTLTVSTTTAAPGASVTVTLTGGLGGATDWIALAPTSAPNNSYVAYTYVGNGVTTRTWTVTMPSTPGTYEFRLFPNNGYTRAATSATVTVQ